jgi:hypothetical protein
VELLRREKNGQRAEEVVEPLAVRKFCRVGVWVLDVDGKAREKRERERERERRKPTVLCF